MKQPIRRGSPILIPAIFLIIIAAIATLTLRQAGADQPPDIPDFEGEPFEITINGLELQRETLAAAGNVRNEWETIFSENFEDDSWESEWLNISLNGAPFKYGTRDVGNDLDATSTMQNWAVGGGAGGEALNPNSDGYPPDVDSWLVAGPFDLSAAADAELIFESYFEADEGGMGVPGEPGDLFRIGVSVDGSTYVGLTEDNGGDGEWMQRSFNLQTYAGEPQVWIAFAFVSDSSENSENKLGLLLDNIELQTLSTNTTNIPLIVYGASPTPSPTPPVPPTPTPDPAGDYLATFTDTIVPWEVRRYTNGATFDLSHADNCDQGSRCGFLQLQVLKSGTYAIASPLVQGRPLPYNIEMEALVKDPEDLQGFGVIFGANWDGQPCPDASNNTCFTQYYELRVRYRDNGTNTFLEYKLKRIDGHDSNNQNFGPDLIDWKKVDADEKKFSEWDIHVSTSGKINISANNNPVGSVTDTTYLANRYFGVIVRDEGPGEARVKFDYFKVDEG